jgi:hypothetical protein
MGAKEKYDIILKYLTKNYTIKDGSFWDVYDPHKVHYDYIIRSLVKIFSFNRNLCKLCLKRWSLKNGLNYEQWENLSNALKFSWTPEMAQDLRAYHNIDAEAELTALLTHEIAQEIDRDIVNQLFILANERLNNTYW